MGCPPRNRLFYRPLLVDVHDIVTEWEQKLARWRRREVVLTVILMGAVAAGFGATFGMSARLEKPPYTPRYANSPAAVVSELESRGALLGRDPSGRILRVVAAGFSDADLALLAGLPDLQSVLFVDCPVTDGGVMVLRTMPSLRSVRLIDTQVTEAGSRSLQQALPQAYVLVTRTTSEFR